MSRRDTLAATAVALIWGMNFTVIDLGLTGLPPTLFVALRFVVVLVPAILLVPRPEVPLGVVLRIGVFLTLGHFALLYTALSLGMPAGLASLVLQAQVLLTVVIAALRLRERPTRTQWLGILLGGLGLCLVAAGRSAHTPLLGLLLVLAAALSWATGNVMVRAAGVRSGLSMTVWSALVVPVPMLGLALLLDGPHEVALALGRIGWPAVLSTAYTAYLSTLLGFGIWNGLLARCRAAEVVPFTLLVPVAGMLTAWVVQDERPNPAELTGALVLLAGLAAIVLRRPQPPPAQDPATQDPATQDPATQDPDRSRRQRPAPVSASPRPSR